jgi:hypothetical protein
MSALRCFATALALAAAVPAGAQAPAVRFGVVGDMPYNALEEPGFEQLLKAFDAEPFDFVVHLGDFKSGSSDCSDALFDARRRQFDAAAHPFVYTPGDNEWTDCTRLLAGRHDPLERLARLRALFAPPGVTLGRRTLKVERQEAYPENARWAVGPAVFATFNMPGPDNNARAMPDEARARNIANLAWLRELFAAARTRGVCCVALFTQANVFGGFPGPPAPYEAFRPFIGALAREVAAFTGAVLFVNGDTHFHRIDRPLRDPQTGKPVPNLTRLETYGSPVVHGLAVSILPEAGDDRFRIEPFPVSRAPSGAQ